MKDIYTKQNSENVLALELAIVEVMKSESILIASSFILYTVIYNVSHTI